jgi:hypothetical protein
MSNWKEVSKETKDVKVGVRTNVIFQANEGIPEVKNISSSCGCSVPHYDNLKGTLKVAYTPDQIPKHLTKEGFYISTKTIVVVYVDGSHDILTFKSKVKK